MGMFSRLPFIREPATLVVHIDVGASASRAALVKIGSEREPEMVFTSKEAIASLPRGDRKDLPSALFALRGALEETAKYIEASKRSGRGLSVEKIYAVFASPYYLSHTAALKYKEQKPFTVTPALVSKVLAGYRSPKSESEAAAAIGSHPQAANERIVSIKVNGYATAAPYGKKGTTLDLSVFRTEMAGEAVSGVEREVRRFFTAPISFEPLSLAAYVALRNAVHFEKDFLFVIIGNEVTEASLVRNDSLLETVSFPLGARSLLRHMARELKGSEETVRSSLVLAFQDGAAPQERARIEAALDSASPDWSPYIEKALVSLSERTAVPSSVYVVADEGVREAAQRFLEKDGFARQSLVPTGFSVLSVDTEKAKSVMRFGKDAACDPVLCLEGLFAVSTKLALHKEAAGV